ncbi:hypothetical protein F4604DRAFT_1686637 [Suillus subluteus]|nr:hypothetical protein F4604DRAFT_1686637 [Suillus subluteus]
MAGNGMSRTFADGVSATLQVRGLTGYKDEESGYAPKRHNVNILRAKVQQVGGVTLGTTVGKVGCSELSCGQRTISAHTWSALTGEKRNWSGLGGRGSLAHPPSDLQVENIPRMFNTFYRVVGVAGYTCYDRGQGTKRGKDARGIFDWRVDGGNKQYGSHGK